MELTLLHPFGVGREILAVTFVFMLPPSLHLFLPKNFYFFLFTPYLKLKFGENK